MPSLLERDNAFGRRAIFESAGMYGARFAWHFAAQIHWGGMSVSGVVGRSIIFLTLVLARFLCISSSTSLYTHIEDRWERRSLVVSYWQQCRSILNRSTCCGCAEVPTSSFKIRSKFLSSQFFPCICFQNMNFRPTSFRFSRLFSSGIALVRQVLRVHDRTIPSSARSRN